MRKEIENDFELRLNTWIIHHFKVLPTDKRYKTLTQNQKYLILMSYLYAPTSEEMRLSVLKAEYEAKQRSFTDEEKEALIREGFKVEDLEKITKDISSMFEKDK